MNREEQHTAKLLIAMVEPWAGSRERAIDWFENQSLPSFGNLTPADLVRQARAVAVKAYIERIYVDGYDSAVRTDIWRNMKCVSERNIRSELGAFKDRIGRKVCIRCASEVAVHRWRQLTFKQLRVEGIFCTAEGSTEPFLTARTMKPFGGAAWRFLPQSARS